MNFQLHTGGNTMTLEQARELEDAEKRLNELRLAAGLSVSEKSNGPTYPPAGTTEAKPRAPITPAALNLEQSPVEWAKGIEARVSATEVSVRDAVQRAWAETEKMRDIIRAEFQRIRVVGRVSDLCSCTVSQTVGGSTRCTSCGGVVHAMIRCDRCKEPLVLMPGGRVAHVEEHGKAFDHEPIEEIPF